MNITDTFGKDDIDLLASKIKAAESDLEPIIPASKPFIIRLDGVSFKKYTQDLKKPFDQKFTLAMKSTGESLMKAFQPTLAFVQSDEISLLFNPVFNKETSLFNGHLYNGRIFKLISVIAGAASVYFMKSSFLNKSAYFDARVVTFDSLDKVLLWRGHDLRRNAINSIGQAHYGHEKINNVSLKDLEKSITKELGKLEDKYGHDNLFGTLFKRNLIMKSGYDPIKKLNVQAQRTVIEGRSIDLLNPQNQHYLQNSFW